MLFFFFCFLGDGWLVLQHCLHDTSDGIPTTLGKGWDLWLATRGDYDEGTGSLHSMGVLGEGQLTSDDLHTYTIGIWIAVLLLQWLGLRIDGLGEKTWHGTVYRHVSGNTQ
jgi:hypothetical protein